LGVLGCRVRFNRLMETVLPYSFECTVEAAVESPGDTALLAGEAAGFLGSMLGSRLSVEGPRHWEFSGGRFNLYSFRLLAGSGVAGVLRVVEVGGAALNVSGAFYPGAEAIVGGLSEVSGAGVAEEGFNLGVTYLGGGGGGGLPPGQRLSRGFTVYAVEGVQRVEGSGWRLAVEGSVARPLTLGLEDLVAMGAAVEGGGFHCVTGWSVGGVEWGGVRLSSLLAAAGAPREGWLAAVSSGGYVAVVPLEEAWRPEALLALYMDGRPLSREHGYPARLYLPRLYGWKHAKWVERLVVLGGYEDGYWEALGYHERGLASAEERFKVRSPRVAEEGLPPRGRARPLPPPGW